MTNEQGSIKQGRILVKGNMTEIFTDVDFFCVSMSCVFVDISFSLEDLS